MACPARSRYVSATIATQRGLDPTRRHREDLPAERYIVSPGAVCARSRDRRGRCFTEHNPRRKTCPLLSDDAIVHEPGVYVSGVTPFEDDEDDAFETLIIGPYPVDSRRVRVKRVDLMQVFANHAIPDNVAPRFYSRDTIVPTVDMLRDHLARTTDVPEDHAECYANMRRCVRTLDERYTNLKEVKRRCARDPESLRACRRFLRNVFLFAMYARRWAGPGTAYPIASRDTNRNVGQHKPLSPSLRGKAVHVSRRGDVTMRDDGDMPADEVDSGRAISMYYTYLRAARQSLEDIPARDFLVSRLHLAIRQPTVDGTFWPAEELVWETLFAEDRSVATATTCTRQVSAALLRTCILLTPYLYRSTPQWMRFEGTLDDIQ